MVDVPDFAINRDLHGHQSWFAILSQYTSYNTCMKVSAVYQLWYGDIYDTSNAMA